MDLYKKITVGISVGFAAVLFGWMGSVATSEYNEIKNAPALITDPRNPQYDPKSRLYRVMKSVEREIDFPRPKAIINYQGSKNLDGTIMTLDGKTYRLVYTGDVKAEKEPGIKAEKE